MRWVWINVHQIKDKVIIEKRNKKNIPMAVNVLTKKKSKQEEMNIDISDDSRRVAIKNGVSESWDD